jgi:hypothetical protein
MAAEPISPVLFFAIDASGSMNDVPTSGSTNGQSKWAVLRGVWPQLMAGLPASWAVGMMEWSCPGCPNSAYQPSIAVPIAPLDSTQVTALSTALTTTPLGGYTPTEAAYMYAIQQVQDWNAPSGYVVSPRYVVLLIDGIPTVNSDGATLGGGPQDTITAEEYAHLIATVGIQTATTGIKTFVVGLPGSEDPQGAAYDPMYLLSLVAQGTAIAGCTPVSGTSNGTIVNPRGTYCHYDLTQWDFATGLQDTINEIAETLVSCEYAMPQLPPPYIMLSTTGFWVTYTTGSAQQIQLSKAPSDDCANGGDWYVSGVDSNSVPTQIGLCADMCARAQADLTATINVEFVCLEI